MASITCSNCKVVGHRYTSCQAPLKPQLQVRKNNHQSTRQSDEGNTSASASTSAAPPLALAPPTAREAPAPPRARAAPATPRARAAPEAPRALAPARAAAARFSAPRISTASAPDGGYRMRNTTYMRKNTMKVSAP
nr:oleosin-B6-like [Lolium perenne]